MCIGEQSKGFILDYAVAFARAGLQPVSVDHRDMAAAVTDQSFMLQFAGFFRDTFAAHTPSTLTICSCVMVIHSKAIDRGLTAASGTLADPLNDTDCRPKSGISV